MNIKNRLLYKEFQLLFRTAQPALITWTLAEVVIAFFGPIQSRTSKLLFDTVEYNIFLNNETGVVYSVLLVICILFVIKFLFMLSLKIEELSLTYLATKVSSSLHRLVIKKLAAVPFIKYEDAQFYNELHTVKNEIDGGNLIQVYVSIVGSLIRLAAIAVMLTMLSSFSVIAAIISVVCCIPGFLHQRKYGKESWEFATASIPQIRKMSYFFKLIVSPEAFKENKLYGLSNVFKKRHDELYEDHYDRLKIFHSNNCGKGIVMALIHSAGTVSVIGWVYISAAKGVISLGDAVMYASLSGLIYNGVQYIVQTASRITESYRLAGNIIDFLSEEQGYGADNKVAGSLRIELKENKNDFTCVKEVNDPDEITFKDVEFFYPGSDRKTLDGITFAVKKGQKVAIAGENGSGKSTLAKLLLGLYPATGGNIIIKGKDVNEFSADQKASTFSICFQDYFLYSYSIRENIGFGNLNKINDDACLLDAAEKSGFASTIGLDITRGQDGTAESDGTAEPGGYFRPDRFVGLDRLINRDFSPDGIVLSGGQSQKLALARAFSSDGDILVLDEPSASLDIVSEHEIFERTLSLMSNKTVFIITHRLANIISADIILYIKDGKICETGSHRELMHQKGELPSFLDYRPRGMG